MKRVIRIGSRRSRLAKEQARIVAEMLKGRYVGVSVEILGIKAAGDEDAEPRLRGKDSFIRAIDELLLAGEIDVAVHSAKDVPTKLMDGLVIAAIPVREDARDALISARGLKLSELPEGASIGTSSIRRKVQLLAIRPDLHIVEIHGNVDTRIRKMRELGLDAVVLAYAGLKRLGMHELITEVFPTDLLLPSVGQGAILVEARKDDVEVISMLSSIDSAEVRTSVEAERAFAEGIGGGCNTPVAAYADVREGRVVIDGMVASIDGRVIRSRVEGPIFRAKQLGLELAAKLINNVNKNQSK